ncbi:IPExxxVDY family protein [Croceivirga thetidis]|uniref:IPExxxVDY family protein n=1 Tax=Croceivirga thetidis TaxID=2721623 RepID=A0ABX1GN96_9FLAO|nr:IPExxxVDY family protein [Croceivirga thetidis]NKI31378.1 IPExxxVDY family protein [Croceivirga thetidis]
MATTYKISSELYDESFGLIALHSSMPAYTLVYYLNSTMELRLSRLENDFKIGRGNFPVYEWYDEKTDSSYYVYGNQSTEEETLESVGLFSNASTIKSYYLLDEKKECDYFFRIDTDFPKIESNVLRQIKLIEGIALAYLVDVDTLKSKQNLIL